MKGCHTAAALATVAALAVGASTVLAQARPAESPASVIEVRIEGNKRLSEAAVMSFIKIRPGQPYSDQVVREDEQRLLKTRRFDNVVATRTPTDKGMLVTFVVTERPVVESLRFFGNKAVQTKELEKLAGLGANDPIDRFQIDTAVRAVENRYKNAGYQFVQVQLDEQALRDQQRIEIHVAEGPKSTLRSVRLEGNRAFSSFWLKTKLGSKAKFWPFLPGTVDQDQIERDAVELRTFYRQEGYLDAQVGRRLDFSPDKRNVVLTFTLEEGPLYHVRDVVLEGNRVFANAELLRRLKLTPGAAFNALALRRDLEVLRDAYGEIGFISVQINVRTRYVGPTGSAPADGTAQVDLLYAISEDGQFTVGAVEVRGNRNTKENVVRRQLQFQPGQLYNTVAVEDTRRRLTETRLFNKVTITPFGEDEDVRNALVEVEEAQTGQFIIGAGISSNVGLLGNLTYTERNFDIFAWPRKPRDWAEGRAFKGAGQIFTLSAEPGLEFSRFRLDWTEPYLMDKPYTLGAGLYAFTAGRDTYDETRYGAQASLGHLFSNRWYAELAARLEGVDINSLDDDAPPDVVAVKGTNFLAGLKGTLARDNTDSRWLPSKGDRLSLSYEQVGGDFVFGNAVADYHAYHTVYRDALDRKHILAERASVGNIFGDAPVFERFYGGGLGSVRGFEYRGISPRQGPGNDAVGGDFMLFLGAEYTFPLVAENLRGVVFLDSGTVERTAALGDYRVSAGFGLRLQVPFFGPVPMTLDFGFPLKKAEHDDTQLVSFSFGWVF